MTSVPDRLRTAQSELAEAFDRLHYDNNTTQQTNPHLREAVSATSAALSAVKRAIGHADKAYTKEQQ